MPELPDVELYLAALGPRIVGQTLERVRLATPFLLRSVDPPLDSVSGKTIVGLRRLGKRIVWQFDDLVGGRALPRLSSDDCGKISLARSGLGYSQENRPCGVRLSRGTLLLTEAATRKRASLHVVRGEAELLVTIQAVSR